MARPRKRHIQQSLDLRDPAEDRRGGKRKGAGRPPKNKARPSERHKKRPKVDPRHPVHVTLRAVDSLGSLRKRDVFHAIGDATVAVVKHENFRIVHLSIQRNHIHLIVEAASKKALSSGMKAFQISAAKRINRAIGQRTGRRRKGQVFADRYHARSLTSPRAVRNALCYVLNNWRHHDEHQRIRARGWKIDPYSSGLAFPDWKERAESPILYRPPSTYLGLVTWRPRSWLLSEGWKRHGLISIYEVPG